jgi:chemotaxis protein methyltransferase CheR
MTSESTIPELSVAQFNQISEDVYRTCGIHLPGSKKVLVKSRLAKRLRLLGLNDFTGYLDYVRQDASGREMSAMMEVLTTNKTCFFREAQHFDYLRLELLPQLRAQNRPIRCWSAGCSSGEEPYTLAMLLQEELPQPYAAQILATDLSTRVLAKARAAIYEEELLSDVPVWLRQKYFTLVPGTPPRKYQVLENIRALVRFARLNLMEPWPMKGPFDIIFCRNVMIYFDKPTQQTLVQRYTQLLRPGGLLFVGHAESLSALTHELRYVQPAVYVR